MLGLVAHMRLAQKRQLDNNKISCDLHSHSAPLKLNNAQGISRVLLQGVCQNGGTPKRWFSFCSRFKTILKRAPSNKYTRTTIDRDPYIIQLAIVVSLYFGGKSQVSNGQIVSFKEP